MKKNRPRVADMGGPAVLCAFLTGIFYYIGVNFFLFGSSSDLARIRLFTEFRYFIHGNIY
jgi:hypothetical protein